MIGGVPAGPDVLLQVHIPKCAGTSVSRWLRRAADSGLTSGFGAFYPDFILTPDLLWEAGLNDPRITTASAHNVRTFPSEIHGRRMQYFTLLRRPREHVISALRYLLQERDAYRIPAHVPSTLPAVAEWLMQSPPDTIYRENCQTNHIALFTWCAGTHGRCDPRDIGDWTARDRHTYERERLDLAKEILSGFLVAGTVERLVETMTLVRSRAEAAGIVLPRVESIARDNVTQISAAEAFDALEQHPVCDRLRDSVAVDRELHAFATGLLDAAKVS